MSTDRRLEMLGNADKIAELDLVASRAGQAMVDAVAKAIKDFDGALDKLYDAVEDQIQTPAQALAAAGYLADVNSMVLQAFSSTRYRLNNNGNSLTEAWARQVQSATARALYTSVSKPATAATVKGA